MKYFQQSHLRLIIIFSLTFLVSSCGGTWQHNYKTESTFYSEKNSCSAEANRVYPPLMSVPSSYGSNNTETTCKQQGYDVVCTTTDSPSYYVDSGYDKNQYNRENYWESCMRGKGWRFVAND